MVFTGKTRNLGLIGFPVEHSLSPAIQHAAIQAAGLDYAYIAMPVEAEALSKAVAGLKSLGFSGFNVTIPHKVNVMEFLDDMDEQAKMIGAVNTVAIKDGRLYGHNTDSIGFITSLEENGFSIKGRSAVLLGAGGGARAVIGGLINAGISSIEIGVRNVAKVQPLVDYFSAYVAIKAYDWQEEAFQKRLATVDLLVNTTPLGMYPRTDDMPLVNWDYIKKDTFVYDIIYTPQKTKFLRQAEQRGNPILNGEGMLLGQMVAALKIWTGRDVDIDSMRKALRECTAV